MNLYIAILSTLLLTAGCKTHHLPALPTERDPVSEAAPVVPYRGPADVLTTELSTGAPAPMDHSGHEAGEMKPTEQRGHDSASPPAGHEGHELGNSPEPGGGQ